MVVLFIWLICLPMPWVWGFKIRKRAFGYVDMFSRQLRICVVINYSIFRLPSPNRLEPKKFVVFHKTDWLIAMTRRFFINYNNLPWHIYLFWCVCYSIVAFLVILSGWKYLEGSTEMIYSTIGKWKNCEDRWHLHSRNSRERRLQSNYWSMIDLI